MKKPVTIKSRETAKWRHRLTVALLASVTACVCLFFVFGLALDAQASGETDDATVILWIEGTNLPRNNPVFYIFRYIGWLLLRGMKFLVNGLQTVVFTVTDGMATLFTGASDSPNTWGEGSITQTWNTFLPIAFLLLTLVILYIGITFIVKPQKVSKLAMNTVIGILVAVSLPFFVGGAFTLTSQLSHVMMDSFSSSDDLIGTQIIMNGTYDVLKLDNADLLEQLAASPGNDDSQSLLDQWKADPDNAPVNLHPTTIFGSEYALQHIDPTEMVGLDGLIDDGATEEDKFWGNTVTTNKDGIKELKSLGDGKIGDDGTSGTIISTQYYRWNFDWLPMFVELGVMTFVLLMCGIKLVRLLFDLLVKQFLAQLLAFLDIHTLQRLKKCIHSLVGSFAAFFGTFLVLELYLAVHPMINTWLNGLTTGWAVIGRILIEIGLAWAVIDGPDIFEKLFGIDVGVKSAVGTLYGLQSLAHGAAAVGLGIFGTKNPSDKNKRYGGIFWRGGVAEKAACAAGAVVTGAAGVGGVIAGGISGARAARRMNQAGGQGPVASPGGFLPPGSSGGSNGSPSGGSPGGGPASGPSGGSSGGAGASGKSGQMAGASQTMATNGTPSPLGKEALPDKSAAAGGAQGNAQGGAAGAAGGTAGTAGAAGGAASGKPGTTPSGTDRLTPAQAADMQNALSASQNQRSGLPGTPGLPTAGGAQGGAAGAPGSAGTPGSRAMGGAGSSPASGGASQSGAKSAVDAAASRMNTAGNQPTELPSEGGSGEPAAPDMSADGSSAAPDNELPPDQSGDEYGPSEPEYQSDDFANDNAQGSGGSAPASSGASGGQNQNRIPDTWDTWAAKQAENLKTKIGQSGFTRPIRTARRAYDLTRNTVIKHALDNAYYRSHPPQYRDPTVPRRM